MRELEQQKFYVKILYWYALNVARMLTDRVEDSSIVMYKNAKA